MRGSIFFLYKTKISTDKNEIEVDSKQVDIMWTNKKQLKEALTLKIEKQKSRE